MAKMHCWQTHCNGFCWHFRMDKMSADAPTAASELQLMNSFHAVGTNMLRCVFSLNLGRVPAWSRLHSLGPPAQSSYRTTYNVNRPWTWPGTKRYHHSRGDVPNTL